MIQVEDSCVTKSQYLITQAQSGVKFFVEFLVDLLKNRAIFFTRKEIGIFLCAVQLEKTQQFRAEN